MEGGGLVGDFVLWKFFANINIGAFVWFGVKLLNTEILIRPYGRSRCAKKASFPVTTGL